MIEGLKEYYENTIIALEAWPPQSRGAFGCWGALFLLLLFFLGIQKEK
jgi:hypothetical protein